MVIKYYVYGSAEVTENLVVKIYEAQAPEAVVYTETLAAPHTGGHLVTANGLDKVVHIVRLYGATSNFKYQEYNVEPLTETAVVFDPIFFKIGDGGANTPAAGTKTYQNDLLKDLSDTDYKITRNNYGILFHGAHYTVNTGAGSWSLMGNDQMNEGEEFVIERKPLISQSVGNDSVVGKWFAGFVDIAANTAYDPAHLRKLVRFSGTCTYTLSGAIPVGYVFCFQHYGTSGTGTVAFQNAALKWMDGTTKASVALASGQEAGFVFDGTAWNVVYLSDGATASNQSEPPVGTVLYAGEYPVSDVPAGDPQYTVQHGQNISWNYTVQLSIKTNSAAAYYANNKVGATWWHHPTDKANKFNFSLQEISSEVQNISVSWMLIKI